MPLIHRLYNDVLHAIIDVLHAKLNRCDECHATFDVLHATRHGRDELHATFDVLHAIKQWCDDLHALINDLHAPRHMHKTISTDNILISFIVNMRMLDCSGTAHNDFGPMPVSLGISMTAPRATASSAKALPP